jgi:hypothetical protein
MGIGIGYHGSGAKRRFTIAASRLSWSETTLTYLSQATVMGNLCALQIKVYCVPFFKAILELPPDET